MSDTVVLEAELREKVGKGAARAVRRQGRVPAVIYGDKKAPIAISLTMRETLKQLNSGQIYTTLYEIDVNGEKSRVLARDVALDPVKDFPVHIDFLRIAKGATVTVMVPVNFLNQEECPGIRQGGVLNIVRHEVELDCPADAIPDAIDLDLITADLGDSLHISAVNLPKGATPTITDRDFTIATIASPAGLKSESDGEEGEEEGAEAPEAEAGDED